MANNRVEAKAAVNAAIVPAVSNAEHIALLNDEINESVVWGKDVIASETESGGNVTIDYSNKDTATVTTAVNLAVSFTNIENGAVKYLVITKAAGNTLTFAGAINSTNFQKYINVNLTSAPYIVYNKNGIIYVKSLRETIIEAIKADIDSANLYKFPTAKAVKDAISALDASDIISGAFADARIPNLATGKITSGIFVAARIPAATESAIGGLRTATAVEAKALTSNSRIVTPLRLANVNAGLLTKIVNIEDWNMNSSGSGTFFINVAHTIADFKKIRRVTAYVRNDADNTYYPLDSVSGSGATTAGGVGSISSTNVTLIAATGQVFDSGNFATTSYNRGWIIIDYIN